MNYLVLGSAGQIGQHLCKYLEKQGHTVCTWDILSNPYEDLRISGRIDDTLELVDFVFFLAYDVGGSRYLSRYQHTYDFIQNNTRILSHTFESLKNSNKPFIFASSQMSNMSHSPYGITKGLGECFTNSIGGCVVKFWNVYGIEHDAEKSHVITDFIYKARTAKHIDAQTDGYEIRQFLHADDCSEALYTLAQQYHTLDKSKNYHITSFVWNTIRDVADIVTTHIPATISYNTHGDTVQKDTRNEPDDYILRYWQPKISLTDGIASLIYNHEQ